MGDDSTGLQYLNARYNDPNVGFMSIRRPNASYESSSRIFSGWLVNWLATVLVGVGLVLWIGGLEGLLLFVAFTLFVPTWMLKLSWEVVAVELVVEADRVCFRYRNRWRTRSRRVDELQSIRVHRGPVNSLGYGAADGCLYFRFAGWRRLRGPEIERDGLDQFLAAIKAYNPTVEIYETRFGTLRRFRRQGSA